MKIDKEEGRIILCLIGFAKSEGMADDADYELEARIRHEWPELKDY